MTTNQPTSVILSESELAEIEGLPPYAEVDGIRLIALTASKRDALCQTVRALKEERAKAITLLSPDIPRTDLCDAARQIVFAHALEKGNAEKLQEKNAALREHLAQSERERNAYRGQVVGLNSRLAQVEKELTTTKRHRDDLIEEVRRQP